MLKDLITEWNNALATSVSIEDKINDTDHETFEYRKAAIMFRGKRIEILSKRRPGSGLNADAKVDPAKGPKYLVSIFVPETGKIIENLPADSTTPQADKMIAILEALDVVDHAASVHKHRQEREGQIIASRVGQWTKALDGAGYTEDEVKLLIEYAKEMLARPQTHSRADIFIHGMKEFAPAINTTEEVTATRYGKTKVLHTMVDVLYNTISQIVSSELKNNYGDYFVPRHVVSNKFWDTTNEMTMKESIRKTRSLLRDIYSYCRESTAAFAFMVNGIAKLYEARTGESVQMRLAKCEARKREAKAAKELQAQRHPKPRQRQPKERKQDAMFGNIGEIFDSLKI